MYISRTSDGILHEIDFSLFLIAQSKPLTSVFFLKLKNKSLEAYNLFLNQRKFAFPLKSDIHKT